MAMTDIGRLRELAEQAALIAEKKRWDDSPKYFSTGWTKDTFIPFARWYDDIAAALNAAPHLISEIETLRAENERLKAELDESDDAHSAAVIRARTAERRLAAAERVVEAARKWFETGRSDAMMCTASALAAYDQGKVTICGSAPTEGE